MFFSTLLADVLGVPAFFGGVAELLASVALDRFFLWSILLTVVFNSFKWEAIFQQVVPLGLVDCGYLHLVNVTVVPGGSHPVEPLLRLPPDVFYLDVGRKVHFHNLEGSAGMLFCGPLGGSHAEAGVLRSIGEGLEVVFISSAVEQIGSRPGPGYSDPVWDPDDLSEFSWGTHLLDPWAFYHQRWNPY